MRSGTLRSSSRSGQWSATPSPKISTRVHSCGRPCHSRGNHMSGTIIVRPSTRSIVSDSWSTRTPVARASRTSATEEFIPPLQERLPMSLHDRRYLVQLRTAVATGIGKRHRIEPELRHLVLRSHVDMRWLAAVVRRKEEAMRTISQNTWHLPSTLIPRLTQDREKSNSDLAARRRVELTDELTPIPSPAAPARDARRQTETEEAQRRLGDDDAADVDAEDDVNGRGGAGRRRSHAVLPLYMTRAVWPHMIAAGAG